MDRSTGTIIALSLLTTFASPAFAQTSAGRDPTAAEALFLAGREAMKNGDFAVACAKFKESDRLDPATGTAANLADCQEKLGRVAAAWASWKEAIELLPANDPRLTPMRDRASAIEKRVPRLTVHGAATLPPDATMTRDDVEMTRASLDTAIPEEPGAHVIVVKAQGHADRSYAIVLKEGASTELTVDAGEDVAAPALPITPPPPVTTTTAPSPPPRAAPVAPDQAPPDAHPGKTNRLVGFGLVGLGVVAAGVGSVTGIVALSKKSDLESDCFPKNVCNASGASAASVGHSMALVSTVSFVVAGAALAGGAVLILTAPKSKVTTAVAPAVGPRSAGLTWETTF